MMGGRRKTGFRVDAGVVLVTCMEMQVRARAVGDCPGSSTGALRTPGMATKDQPGVNPGVFPLFG